MVQPLRAAATPDIITVRDRMCWLAEGLAYRQPHAFQADRLHDSLQDLQRSPGAYRALRQLLESRLSAVRIPPPSHAPTTPSISPQNP